jgi:hypothetical protein
MSEEHPGEKLTLIVAEGVEEEELAPGESEQHGFREYVRKRMTKKTEVDLGAVQSELDGMQIQIDSLLSRIQEPSNAKFRLAEIEFGLSITAEGSIGIATVGGEVSVTLTYSRKSE